MAQTTRQEVFAALWQDPKFVRLNAHKDKVNRALTYAEAYASSNPVLAADIPNLKRRFKRAMRNIVRYEDAAMKAAGAPSF